MSGWFRIVHGDVVARASLFVDDYFDACLCDPPYLLQFMGKEFDKQHKKMSGANEGQKMQAWHERWTREVLRVLKPGAHMLAFGGTRTYHRLASAAEDVGFEIRDMLEWIHGQGFPKGKTQLKPAHEPILLAAKPGKHFLDIDVCRIAGTVPKTTQGQSIRQQTGVIYAGKDQREKKEFVPSSAGRWPANLLLSHHETCNEECHPDCPVRMLDEQSGYSIDRPAQKALTGDGSGSGPRQGRHYGASFGGIAARGYQTSGGASRFFYCAKVSSRERNLGGIDCRHPTLKPIALTTYLARLLLPPARPKPARRLFVPFSGAGSEIIGALLAGWDEVWGIEQDLEYIADAEARIAARHTLDPSAHV